MLKSSNQCIGVCFLKRQFQFRIKILITFRRQYRIKEYLTTTVYTSEVKMEGEQNVFT